jgi:lipopolysaccharide biosynthesis protein
MHTVTEESVQSLKNSGVFDEQWYLKQYPDVARLGIDPARHFLLLGQKIGRDPSPTYSNADYVNRRTVSDGASRSQDGEGGVVSDNAGATTSSGQPAAGGAREDVRHLAELVRDSRLFDGHWYAEYYGLEVGEDPLMHFVNIGMAAGHDPSMKFSGERYLAKNEDIKNSGMQAFHHYIVAGRAEYRVIYSRRKVDSYTSISEKMPDTFFLRQRTKRHRIAVVVHAFYPEIWPEVVEYISNISEGFDLYVSLVHECSENIEQDIIRQFPFANVLVFPNHGRDVFPFTEFLNAGVLDEYELVCKIHTKRSLHRADGDAWRQSLYNGLLGTKQLVDDICAHMRADPDVTMVVPDGYIYDAQYMGSNAEALVALTERIELEFDINKMLFPAGNMFWISATVVQFLKALRLTVYDYELEEGQLDGTKGHAIERFAGVACTAAAQKMITTSEVSAVPKPEYDGSRHQLIAFYLPQYHPIPENDRWWGKGFTEWRNVEKATPLFEGHNQPRRPADLGYYDLRVDQVRVEQAEMAKKFGIDAFCYYHYWFYGRQLLELPLNRLIASKNPDFPFCICWANENWTRSWDGMNKDVLMPQRYDPEVLKRYPFDVQKYLADPRYLRFNDKPVFLIYKIMDLPNPKQVIEGWRETWRRLGIGDVHIAAVRSFPDQETTKVEDLGVDAFVDFPPHSISPFMKPAEVSTDGEFDGSIYRYQAVLEGDLMRYEQEDSTFVHRGVMGAWDNTARRGRKAHMTYGASPVTFRSWLRRSLIQDAAKHPGQDRLTFINAWNEWAEGTYLEPDQRYGIGFLEAVRSVRPLDRGQ